MAGAVEGLFEGQKPSVVTDWGDELGSVRGSIPRTLQISILFNFGGEQRFNTEQRKQ